MTELVPSLSRSLAEQFNVFRVMHHGTHEKQLSNVFAWLLLASGTHGLGDAFQQIFVKRVLQDPASAELRLPLTGYRVLQEVDTAPQNTPGKDIADIVLTAAGMSIVVENFESSDGHGHGYSRYLAYGESGDRQSLVVLLCARREPHRQVDGWEHAAVVTYSELLTDLQHHIADASTWRRAHAEQQFFIEQLTDHFVEGTGAVSIEDRIAFLRTMCETGESARYGYRPQATAAQEFADLLAQHAKRQFEEGRSALGDLKRTLRALGQRTLKDQVNATLDSGRVTDVHARYVGQWEWRVNFDRDDGAPQVFLAFGPTAVAENGRVLNPLSTPDYSRVFVGSAASGGGGTDRFVQTDVGLDEVLSGLLPHDMRLRDALVGVLNEAHA